MLRSVRRLLAASGVTLLGLATAIVICELTLRLIFALGLLADDNPWVRLVQSVRERQAEGLDAERQLFRKSAARCFESVSWLGS